MRLNGSLVSKSVRRVLKDRICDLQKMYQASPPALGMILVGNRPDSMSYVRSKTKACRAVGIDPVDIHLSQDVDEIQLLNQIETFNSDPSIDGILVQMPLPSHLDTVRVIESIVPSKDIDGLHPYNLGKLAMISKGISEESFVPCTPRGIMTLLDHYKVQFEGKVAVVIGRSNLVGIPVAQLLRQRNCTVIHCHSYTEHLEKWTREADILVSACGCPEMIRGDWIKPGAVVVDVGINFTDRLVGDVCYDEAVKKVAAITPVPGGVGPMTIAMLLNNLVDSYEQKLKSHCHLDSPVRVL